MPGPRQPNPRPSLLWLVIRDIYEDGTLLYSSWAVLTIAFICLTASITLMGLHENNHVDTLLYKLFLASLVIFIAFIFPSVLLYPTRRRTRLDNEQAAIRLQPLGGFAHLQGNQPNIPTNVPPLPPSHQNGHFNQQNIPLVPILQQAPQVEANPAHGQEAGLGVANQHNNPSNSIENSNLRGNEPASEPDVPAPNPPAREGSIRSGASPNQPPNSAAAPAPGGTGSQPQFPIPPTENTNAPAGPSTKPARVHFNRND